MKRPGTSEGHQRERARVDASLDGDQPQGGEHLRLSHLEDPLGAGLRGQPELAGEPGDRLLGARQVEPHAARKGNIGR